MVGQLVGPHLLFAWLDRHASNRMLVGGKGASLSRLATLGAPVPKAGALTTTAYTIFADVSGIPRRATGVTIADLPAIRDAIMTAPLPEPVADAITAA